VQHIRNSVALRTHEQELLCSLDSDVLPPLYVNSEIWRVHDQKWQTIGPHTLFENVVAAATAPEWLPWPA
jgi:hypothetical protein